MKLRLDIYRTWLQKYCRNNCQTLRRIFAWSVSYEIVVWFPCFMLGITSLVNKILYNAFYEFRKYFFKSFKKDYCSVENMFDQGFYELFVKHFCVISIEMFHAMLVAISCVSFVRLEQLLRNCVLPIRSNARKVQTMDT